VDDDPGKASLGDNRRAQAERGTEGSREFKNIVIRQGPRKSENKIRRELQAPPSAKEGDGWVVVAKSLANGSLEGADNRCWVPFQPLEGISGGGPCDGIFSSDHWSGARLVVRAGGATLGNVGICLTHWDNLVGIGILRGSLEVHLDECLFTCCAQVDLRAESNFKGIDNFWAGERG